jgi:hypothetical protein
MLRPRAEGKLSLKGREQREALGLTQGLNKREERLIIGGVRAVSTLAQGAPEVSAQRLSVTIKPPRAPVRSARVALIISIARGRLSCELRLKTRLKLLGERRSVEPEPLGFKALASTHTQLAHSC